MLQLHCKPLEAKPGIVNKTLRDRVALVTGASSSIGGAAVTRALARERHVRTLATQWEDVLLEVQAGLDDPVGAVKTLVAGSDVTDREQVTSLLVARTERIQLRLSYGPRCAIIV